MSQDIILQHNDKPVFIMMVGLAGSGKSTIAQSIKIQMQDGSMMRPTIYSSDAIRLELYGDEKDQEHNDEVFKTLKKRIKDELLKQNHVVFDATNLSKKQRTAFLSELKRIQCEKTCACVMTPYELCKQQNESRERQVPEHAIKRMYMNWTPPHCHEGFDNIVLNFNMGDMEGKYDVAALFERINKIDQENHHHTYTIGDHCMAAADYMREKAPHDRVLKAATMLHDIGKEFTKTRINSRGIEDGECHYYQHQCVGAYDSMFYLRQAGFSEQEIIEASNLIYYHMHPYMSWKQSEKAHNRDRHIIGNEMYNKIQALHEADVLAHAPVRSQEINRPEAEIYEEVEGIERG